VILRLVIRPEAEADLSEAFDWYEAQRIGLGKELLSEVGSTLDRIRDGTDRYAKVFRDVRHAPVRRFPYSIYFLREERRIVVLAVLHHRRDPKILRKRPGS
jgi:plasmid stabilization system protein ParE